MAIYRAKNLAVFDDAKIEMHCTNPKTDTYIGGEIKILNTPKI